MMYGVLDGKPVRQTQAYISLGKDHAKHHKENPAVDIQALQRAQRHCH